jgi:chromosome segregation ATPase
MTMTVPEPLQSEMRTLASRLSEGGMQASEALRYGILLGEALRDLHSGGRVHGNISTQAVVLSGTGIDLTPPMEQAEDQAAGVSRDISRFGEVLYEMLAGRRATGEDGYSLHSTCIPAADRLIASCLAKEPQSRLLSMQKVLLELRLISVATRNSGASATAHREAFEAALRTEMQALEARLSARLEEHERRVAERLEGSTEALRASHSELASLRAELATAQLHLEEGAGRLTNLERTVEMAEVERREKIFRIEADIKAQAASIESVRTIAAENDDLIGRVVEALDLLHHSLHGANEESL